VTTPMDFLQSVSGYVAASQENGHGSADRPIKLAKIDPAYDPFSFPGTLPKVTFEGESTLSGKFYTVMDPYRPKPNDRVMMLPIGSTYVIIGKLTYSYKDFMGRLVFHAYQTVSQSISDTSSPVAANAIDWTTSPIDLFDGWSGSTEYQPTVPGWYEFSGGTGIASTGNHSIRGNTWFKNGTERTDGRVAIGGRASGTSNSSVTPAKTIVAEMNGTTDSMELIAIQDSGAARDTNVADGLRSSMIAKYVGPSGALL
jgi:hypothetical protein